MFLDKHFWSLAALCLIVASMFAAALSDLGKGRKKE